MTAKIKPPKISKCHSCVKSAPAETMGTFLLYGLNQWAKMPLFAFEMCQQCFEKLKTNVEADMEQRVKNKIEVVQ